IAVLATARAVAGDIGDGGVPSAVVPDVIDHVRIGGREGHYGEIAVAEAYCSAGVRLVILPSGTGVYGAGDGEGLAVVGSGCRAKGDAAIGGLGEHVVVGVDTAT